MKTRRRNNRPTITSRREYLETMPIDLIFEIFSKLPVKSIARCRCVSKHWASMLRRADFTELFVTRSCARPQLLFVCNKIRELSLFSSPQDHNSSLVTSNYHMKFRFSVYSYTEFSDSVRGWVCLLQTTMSGALPVICNPSTGQILTKLPLPPVKAKKDHVNSFFGYDPIEKQFKVLLAMTKINQTCKERLVLTLGGENMSWRTVECHIPHDHLSRGICIDGVLYYVGLVKRSSTWPTKVIACFDVRSEKFRFIEIDEDMVFMFYSVLVNYKGKLGALLSDHFSEVTGDTSSFEMWVLEDLEKHVWSKHVYEFPSMWKNVVAEEKFYSVGMTGTKEILLAPHFVTDPFYVIYYNIENKTIRRVEIQGMDAYKNYRVYTSVNHAEDVKLMEMFRPYNLRCCNRS